ncbi:MAG: sodium-translocating pyrophosphatase [Sedimentisphaerales bacterium]|nr:sodium-translocating pyrophosphatase [Sedimentisphaerales bacterium]
MKNGTNGLMVKLVGLALTMMLGLAQAQEAPALDLNKVQEQANAAAVQVEQEVSAAVTEAQNALAPAAADAQADAATDAAPAVTDAHAAAGEMPGANAPCDLKHLDPIWYISPVMAIIALIFARKFYNEVKSANPGSDEMQRIASYVTDGALAYLKRQYKVVGIVFVIVSAALWYMGWVLGLQHKIVFFAFLTGGFFSGLCGWFGMKTATLASSRTAQGAKESLNRGLTVAFRAGAVMGLVVVGFGLLDICGWFLVLSYYKMNLVEITVVMLTFGMGASTQALFARVGGGIYTKAADVGADLVGKVEAGIPEDDPRNPATIADNAGDNVGDVAGMGADLYESYCGSILATAALGVSAAVALHLNMQEALKMLAAPMVLAGVGILLSIVGVYMVKTKDGASMKELMASLMRGLWGSSILIIIAAFFICKYLLGGIVSDTGVTVSYLGIFGAIVVGMLAGLVIGKATEYYTSYDFKPTQEVAKNAQTGPATVIISGIAEGMGSTWMSLVTVVVAILLAYSFAGGQNEMLLGLYGIGIAAVSMLSTLGYSLATDAYGPIADNAGGNAEMTHQDPSVREKTDALDSLGNTTAAIGKGFAIGSAALTALALLAAYVEEIRIGLVREGSTSIVAIDSTAKTDAAASVGVMSYINYGKIATKVSEGTDEHSFDVYMVLEGDKHLTVGTLDATVVEFNKENKVANIEVKTAEGIVEIEAVRASQASLRQYMDFYGVNLMNPKVLCGMFAGVLLVFLFTAMTMKAVGRAAMAMVNEVRRQFREIPGILEGKATPEYAKCVAISTAGAQKEMLVPSLLAIIVPIVVGLVLDVSGVLGLLAGGLTAGFAVAIFMANAGGSWDNAKKFIEKGNYGGKRSEAHKAAVTGDTVGDPFKDTSGPSLNILIKLMSMVSVVFAGLIVKFAPIIGDALNLGR